MNQKHLLSSLTQRKMLRLALIAIACTILFAESTLTKPDIVHAEVAWSTPINLSAPTQSASQVKIAVDSMGNAIAVWVSNDGSYSIFKSKSKPAGGSWDATETNLSASVDMVDSPQIVIDHQGNAIALWRVGSTFSSYSAIQAKSKPAGGGWDDTTVDLSAPGDNVSSPRITMDQQGNATAVWIRNNVSNEAIQTKSKPAGGDWDQTTMNLSEPGQNVGSPRIAVDPKGNVTAVWHNFQGTNKVVQLKSKPAGADWEGTATNISEPSSSAGAPEIAVDAKGNIIVIWIHSDGSTKSIIQSKSKAADNSWNAAPTDIITSGLSAGWPQIIVDLQGNATVLWSSFLTFKAKNKLAGRSWDEKEEILTMKGTNASDYDVAYDNMGNVTAIWSSYSGKKSGNIFTVESRSKLIDNKWESNTTTIHSSDRYISNPRIAIDGKGNAIAVWKANYDATHSIIQSAERPPIMATTPSARCTVPKLVGQEFKLGKTKKSKRKAIKRFKKRMSKKLKKSGCSIGKIKRKKLKKAQSKKGKRPRARVIAQSKKAGSKYEEGTKVNLTIGLSRLK